MLVQCLQLRVGPPCLGRNSSGKDLEVIFLQTRNELPLHAVAQEEKQSLKM